MSYSTNSLNVAVPRVGGGDDLTSESAAIWVYRETGDAVLAVMVADDYITDGNEKGVKVGDVICFIETAVDAAWGTVDTVDAAGLVGIILLSNP
jgi:hypothetical protein